MMNPNSELQKVGTSKDATRCAIRSISPKHSINNGLIPIFTATNGLTHFDKRVIRCSWRHLIDDIDDGTSQLVVRFRLPSSSQRLCSSRLASISLVANLAALSIQLRNSQNPNPVPHKPVYSTPRHFGLLRYVGIFKPFWPKRVKKKKCNDGQKFISRIRNRTG